jgi:hypothetical protein
MPNKKPFRPAVPIFAASLLLAMGRAPAVPLYYSFQGEVIYSTVSSHTLGQPVRYVFLVDRDVDGYTLDGEGNILPIADDVETADFYTMSFYSEYIGGDALAIDNPASPIKESCFCGVDQLHYSEIFSALRGSNSDRSGFDLIDIFSYEKSFGEWSEGQSLLAENFVVNAEGELNSSYSSNLILASITDENPLAPAVPEPSVFALFGLGLLGLAVFAKKRA